jgi:hypothetical protein
VNEARVPAVCRLAAIGCIKNGPAARIHQNRSAAVGDCMLLTKHEGETFYNQTVYISGQAFIRCTFTACTLVLRETIYHLQECTFERCNWHVDWVLLWGSPESLREIKALISLIEQAQTQMPDAVDPKVTNTNPDTPFA